MSRSYKKTMTGLTGRQSDKLSRHFYQKSKRRKDKDFCNAIVKKYNIETVFETFETLPTDRISINTDYSCKFSSKYDWLIDGGCYTDFDSWIKQAFDIEVFGLTNDFYHISPHNIWERYKQTLNKKSCMRKYNFVEIVAKTRIAKRQFRNANELVNWFRKNQNRLIATYKRLNYGK